MCEWERFWKGDVLQVLGKSWSGEVGSRYGVQLMLPICTWAWVHSDAWIYFWNPLVREYYCFLMDSALLWLCNFPCSIVKIWIDYVISIFSSAIADEKWDRKLLDSLGSGDTVFPYCPWLEAASILVSEARDSIRQLWFLSSLIISAWMFHWRVWHRLQSRPWFLLVNNVWKQISKLS